MTAIGAGAVVIGLMIVALVGVFSIMRAVLLLELPAVAGNDTPTPSARWSSPRTGGIVVSWADATLRTLDSPGPESAES